MSVLQTTHDVERQVVLQNNRERAGYNLHRRQSNASTPFGIDLQPPCEKHASLSDRARQRCFLCIEGRKTGQYAAQVPCIRPTEPRQIKSHRLSTEVSKNGLTRLVKVPGGEIYEELNPKEKACESDGTIYHRLKGMCFNYQGKWRRWPPFYGITDVREVNFQFLGVVERDGRFPIHMMPINIDQVREEADRTIALEPDGIDAELGACVDENWHSTKCQNTMDVLPVPCIKVQIEAARQRKRKLAMLHLLRDCARDPWNANGWRTLEGMAQMSCIFDIEGPNRIAVPQYHQRYDRTDELWGLQFVLGWQLDRMAYKLPFNIAWTFFGLAVIWLSVVAWAGLTRDWTTAMAFGQLIAASISIVFLYSKD